MTKLERAIAELQKLPPEMQEDWAAMILSQLEQQERYTLTDEQLAELERRMADKDAETLTLDEFRERVRKLIA
jgi:putative addiction module component (TIGR02574 family)